MRRVRGTELMLPAKGCAEMRIPETVEDFREKSPPSIPEFDGQE